MTSMFDPNTFLNATTTEKMETRRTPVPEAEYIALIDDVKLRAAKESVMADIIWRIDNAELAAKMGLPKVTVRQTVFLDINESGTGLATGPNKNVQLGKVREAVGQNSPGPG
jgi:hypothetical protein